jgi:hypothetical protein
LDVEVLTVGKVNVFAKNVVLKKIDESLRSKKQSGMNCILLEKTGHRYLMSYIEATFICQPAYILKNFECLKRKFVFDSLIILIRNACCFVIFVKSFFPYFSNPTTVSYNARVVKIYSATSSLERFVSEIFSFTMKNALAYHNAAVLVLNSKVVRWDPGLTRQKTK